MGATQEERLKELRLQNLERGRAATAKAMAQRALARRVLAQRQLIHKVKYLDKTYKDGWVHHDICRRLDKFREDVAAEKSPRLMLFMPPRHGKSRLASQEFPSHVLGHHPTWEIIAASYAESLPIGFSRKIRNQIATKEYRQIFPDTYLDKTDKAATGWATTAGGRYTPVGVGGGISGKGAHILILDDLVKDAESADSDTIREGIVDWYETTAKTRLAPGGGVLLIMTRWRYDDIAGTLLEQDEQHRTELMEILEDNREALDNADAHERPALEQNITEIQEQLDALDDWEVVEYPAIADKYEYLSAGGNIRRLDDSVPEGSQDKLLRKPGDALHPARYPRSILLNMKINMQPRHWSAMYQQKPTPDEGDYFQRGWFRYERGHPPLSEMKIVVAWDLAVGEKKRNDYTVGLVAGLDWQGHIHLIHMVRGRWSDMETIADKVIDTHMTWQAQMTGVEQGQLSLALGPSLTKRIRERTLSGENISITLAEGDDALRPITDKDMRARPLQGRLQQGMVYLPMKEITPWVEDLEMEFLRFPNATHDDIVDGASWATRMLARMTPPAKPVLIVDNKGKPKSWRDRIKAHVRNSRGGDHMAA